MEVELVSTCLLDRITRVIKEDLPFYAITEVRPLGTRKKILYVNGDFWGLFFVTFNKEKRSYSCWIERDQGEAESFIREHIQSLMKEMTKQIWQKRGL